MSVIDYYDFTHNLDRQTRSSLENIPGFEKLMKAFMRGYAERMNHMENMSSKVLLSPHQLPRIYNLLPPVCERLEIEQPPLYLQRDDVPNAYTQGDNIPDITVTTGLLEQMTDDEVQVVLAHECGHIVCHHVLYRTMGSVILGGSSFFIELPLISDALRLAFYHWIRCSELSADRAAAVFCGNTTDVAQVMFRLAGCPKDADDETSLDAFMSQASSYEEFMQSSNWNKFLSYNLLANHEHPFLAVRASEIMKWKDDPMYQSLVKNLDEGTLVNMLPPSFACSHCGIPVQPGTSFCVNCGKPVNAAPPQFCVSCGTQISHTASFCPNCGKPRQAMAMPGAAPLPGAAPMPGALPQKQSSTDKIKNNIKYAISGARK